MIVTYINNMKIYAANDFISKRQRRCKLVTASLLLLPAGLWHFNMLCLGVILQVRGRGGMSTPQNGAPA